MYSMTNFSFTTQCRCVYYCSTIISLTMSKKKYKLGGKEATVTQADMAACASATDNAGDAAVNKSERDRYTEVNEDSLKPMTHASAAKDILIVRGRRYPRNSLIHNWGLRLLESMLHDEQNRQDREREGVVSTAACHTDKDVSTTAKQTCARSSDQRADVGDAAANLDVRDIAVLCSRRDVHNVLHCTQLHRSNGAILVGTDGNYRNAFYVRINMLVRNDARTAVLTCPSEALDMQFCPCQTPHTCAKLHLLADVVFVRTQGILTAYFASELHHNLGFANLVKEAPMRQCGTWCRKTHSHIIATCNSIHYKHNSNMHAERALPPRTPSALIADLDPVLLLNIERKRRQREDRAGDVDSDDADEEDCGADEGIDVDEAGAPRGRTGRSDTRRGRTQGKSKKSNHKSVLLSSSASSPHGHHNSSPSRRAPTQDLSHLLHTAGVQDRGGAGDPDSVSLAAEHAHRNADLERGRSKSVGRGVSSARSHGTMPEVASALKKRGLVTMPNDILVKGNSVITLLFVLSLLGSVAALIITILCHLPGKR